MSLTPVAWPLSVRSDRKFKPAPLPAAPAVVAAVFRVTDGSVPAGLLWL
jgi:hypothetical protein